MQTNLVPSIDQIVLCTHLIRKGILRIWRSHPVKGLVRESYLSTVVAAKVRLGTVANRALEQGLGCPQARVLQTVASLASYYTSQLQDSTLGRTKHWRLY